MARRGLVVQRLVVAASSASKAAARRASALGYLGLFFSLVLILRVVITIIREGIS
jgi:hypothetical protein